MDTQTFLKDLKGYEDRYMKSPQSSNEFFDYLDSHYEDYIYATPEDRFEIRKFIKGKLFRASNIPQILLMYVRKRIIQKFKSTGDKVWLLRGLVAISMENQRSGPVKGEFFGIHGYDSKHLLAGLWFFAEEKGLDPKPAFEDIARISDDRGTLPMSQLMAGIGIGKYIYELKNYGKFGSVDW
jgi:hypothetical protein